jgi:hypothetical protein
MGDTAIEKIFKGENPEEVAKAEDKPVELSFECPHCHEISKGHVVRGKGKKKDEPGNKNVGHEDANEDGEGFDFVSHPRAGEAAEPIVKIKDAGGTGDGMAHDTKNYKKGSVKKAEEGVTTPTRPVGPVVWVTTPIDASVVALTDQAEQTK